MSTQTEITRLLDARNLLRSKGESLGITLPTDNLTEISIKFDTIVNRGAVQADVMEGETFTIPEGWHNGSGTVSGIAGGGNYNLQQRTVTPTKSQQDITPDQGYFGLSSVTVNPIPAQYQDVSDVTATAANVLEGFMFTTSNGALTAGTMPDNGAMSGSINGLSITSYTVPAGFHNGAGTVSLTNDIELALAAI